MSGFGPSVEPTDKLRAQLAESATADRRLTNVVIGLTAAIAVLVYRTF